MPTLQELFKTKQLPSQNGKTAEEAYDIQNSKDISISSSNALVSATGLAGANLLRKTLGVRGSETLLEEELTGVRIIAAASSPFIYGSRLLDIINKSTPSSSAQNNAFSTNIADATLGNIKKGATPSIVAQALQNKKVGKTDLNTSTTQNRANQLDTIFKESQPSAIGALLNNLLSSPPSAIGGQLLGSAIKLGKNVNLGGLFKKKDSAETNEIGTLTSQSKSASGTVIINNGVTKFTDESAKFSNSYNFNYGSELNGTKQTSKSEPLFNANGVRYTGTIDTTNESTSGIVGKQVIAISKDDTFEREINDHNSTSLTIKPKETLDRMKKSRFNTKRGMDVSGRKYTFDSTDELIKEKDVINVSDSINLQTYWEETAKEKIPQNIKDLDNIDFATLRFTSIPTKKSVQFRATISGLSETVSPSWDSAKFVGNPFSYHTYSGIERSITFNFKIFSLNLEEHKIAWEKLDFLTGLTYPAGYYDTSAVKPPFIKFTLGDMYKNKESFIDSLSYTIDDNTPWEVEEKGYILPTIIDTSLTIKFVEARNNTKKFYSYTSTPQT